jgi:hypothetical protein
MQGIEILLGFPAQELAHLPYLAGTGESVFRVNAIRQLFFDYQCFEYRSDLFESYRSSHGSSSLENEKGRPYDLP